MGQQAENSIASLYKTPCEANPAFNAVVDGNIKKRGGTTLKRKITT